MELWVFGYGSLIWRPGFPYEQAEPARLHGYHRSLCVYSYVHRGTPDKPGLVMGLDRGGSCRGMAYRVAESDRQSVLQYLREREQSTMVYKERVLKIHFTQEKAGLPRSTRALVYCVDRSHKQYAGALDRRVQLEIVQGAEGQSGINPHYVIETSRALQSLGVQDATLEWLSKELRAQDAALTL
ncbi:MAG: gamma-glutamylcyclotransferase [Pseudomonadota bacterium]